MILNKWYYIAKISQASNFYGDKLVEMLNYYNKYGLKDITYKEAKDYWTMIVKRTTTDEKDMPIKPNISCDGWYPYCPICGYFDLKETEDRCPSCNQAIDWNWVSKYRDK